MRVFGKTHEFEQGLDLFADDVFGRADEFERQRDVVVHRAGAQQIEVLENHADRAAYLAQFVVGEFVEHAAVDIDRARGGAVEEVDAAHERAFPGARATDDAEDFSGLDVDRDVLQGVEDFTLGSAIRLSDVLKLDHGVGAFARRREPPEDRCSMM